VRTEDFLKSVSGDSSELRVIYEMNEWDKEETIEDEQGY